MLIQPGSTAFAGERKIFFNPVTHDVSRGER